MDSAPSFGQWLKQRRKALDLTQAELATRAGCAPKTLSMIETGAIRPSRQLAGLLAVALEIPPTDRDRFEQWSRQAQSSGPDPAPTPSIAATPALARSPSYLPASLTPLIGREAEVTQLGDLLARPAVRLLTLTGPPGVGKTRLALAVAALMQEEFANRVWFVELAPLIDPGLVAPTIAQALDVRETAGVPVQEQLKTALRDQTVLLVLDNFEQILPAAPLLESLLQAAPGLKVLVTSRESLGVYGEHEFLVPPLALPDLKRPPHWAEFVEYAAVRLFVERARAVQTTFRLTQQTAPAVARICSRLDGLPLAIELAAARSKLLAPESLLARLEPRLPLLTGGPRNLPARQQTLQAAIAWSYHLLTQDEQKLFRSISVFQGGGTLSAIEIICQTEDAPGGNVLDGLERLVGHSLLQQRTSKNGEPGFGMLETIQEYAREQLVRRGEAELLRDRHLAYFLALAERANAQLRGPQQGAWLDQLASEHANLRAALAWTHDPAGADRVARAERGLRLAGALVRFWDVRNHYTEGRMALAVALADAPAPQDRDGQAARARALEGAGWLAMRQGDHTVAERLFLDSLALCRTLDNRWAIAGILGDLGLAASNQGDEAAARGYYDESLALWRDVGDRWGIGMTLNRLGMLAQARGEDPAAGEYYEESLTVWREVGDHFGVAIVLSNLARIAEARGNNPEAGRLLEESLALSRELGDRDGMALALGNLGLIAAAAGDHEVAQARLAESLALWRELGQGHGHDKAVYVCLLALAGVLAERAGDQPATQARAVRALAAAEALMVASGAVLDPEDNATYGRAAARLRTALGETQFAVEWAAGQVLSLAGAIALALEKET